jgi:hypothetical protein
MPEWAVRKLSYSAGWREIFGFMPRLLMEAEPAVQREIILRAETSVYGGAGLESYEATEKSSLRALARRALAQHLCQRALVGSARVNWLRRMIFALAFPPLLALFVLQTLRSPKTPAETVHPDLVVFFWSERLYKFIGDCHFEEQTYVLHRDRHICFRNREISFFLRAIAGCPRILCYPELLCNFVRWLGYYGYVIRYHRPKQAVVHFFERTASSSLMTAYLHERDLRHIDVQHGENIFTADSAFCQFDEIRLWGEHFRDVFLATRSPGETIRVWGTEYHRELFWQVRNQDQPRPKRLLIIDPFMYEEHEVHYAMIKKVVERLDSGWEVRVRRHPAELRNRLDWMDRLNADLGMRTSQTSLRLEEERPSVPIEEALGRSRVVLGVASAALIEAWIVGCKVIHIAGGPGEHVLMDRYQNSGNVLYCDQRTDGCSLDIFLAEPAALNQRESSLVNHVTAITDIDIKEHRS